MGLKSLATASRGVAVVAMAEPSASDQPIRNPSSHSDEAIIQDLTTYLRPHRLPSRHSEDTRCVSRQVEMAKNAMVHCDKKG